MELPRGTLLHVDDESYELLETIRYVESADEEETEYPAFYVFGHVETREELYLQVEPLALLMPCEQDLRDLDLLDDGEDSMVERGEIKRIVGGEFEGPSHGQQSFGFLESTAATRDLPGPFRNTQRIYRLGGWLFYSTEALTVDEPYLRLQQKEGLPPRLYTTSYPARSIQQVKQKRMRTGEGMEALNVVLALGLVAVMVWLETAASAAVRASIDLPQWFWWGGMLSFSISIIVERDFLLDPFLEMLGAAFCLHIATKLLDPFLSTQVVSFQGIEIGGLEAYLTGLLLGVVGLRLFARKAYHIIEESAAPMFLLLAVFTGWQLLVALFYDSSGLDQFRQTLGSAPYGYIWLGLFLLLLWSNFNEFVKVPMDTKSFTKLLSKVRRTLEEGWQAVWEDAAFLAEWTHALANSIKISHRHEIAALCAMEPQLRSLGELFAQLETAKRKNAALSLLDPELVAADLQVLADDLGDLLESMREDSEALRSLRISAHLRCALGISAKFAPEDDS